MHTHTPAYAFIHVRVCVSCLCMYMRISACVHSLVCVCGRRYVCGYTRVQTRASPFACAPSHAYHTGVRICAHPCVLYLPVYVRGHKYKHVCHHTYARAQTYEPHSGGRTSQGADASRVCPCVSAHSVPSGKPRSGGLSGS